MKTVILSLLAFLCLSLNVSAQTGACKVYDFTLQYISVDPSATVSGKYDLRVNLSWDIEMNSGNKYSYFHIWQESTYFPYDYSNPAKPPMASNLGATLGTIIIKDPSTNPTIVGIYNPDPTYTAILAKSTTGAVLSRELITGSTMERFTIKNLLIPGVTYNPSGTYSFMGDIWSSQHNQGTNVHCSLTGNDFVVNDVISQSLLRCNTGAFINVRLKSTQPSATGSYQLFADTFNPGTFDESKDVRIGSETAFTTSSVTTLANDGSFPYEYLSPEITIPSEYNGKTIWLIVSLTGKSNQVFPILNSCALLPITYSNFSAVRKGQSVLVKWQTSFEMSAAGFHVQRLTDNNWTAITFVPAKNLGSGGSYEWTDLNTYRGLSQYRLVAMDKDGKQKLSDIRSVRGDGVNTKVAIYPNPSRTGHVNLVFDNNAARDISVIDISGRVVKQLRAERSANITLDVQQDGFYQVKITDRVSGDITLEKIVIKMR